MSVSADPCPVALRGVVPSLNTPFTAGDRIDRKSLYRLVDHTVAASCAGMLALAVAGETASLTADERREVIETVLEHTADRLPVVVGVTPGSRAERLKRAALARTLGAYAVLVKPPAGMQGDALAGLLAELGEAGPGVVMLQDLDWYGPGLPVPDIVRLFERVPAFQCLKIETVPAGPKYSAVLEATGGRLHVSGGWAVSQMLDALTRGVHAFMPTAMEFVYCEIYRLFVRERAEEARALFETMLPIVAFSNQHIDIGIRFFKRLRNAAGLFSTDRCRPPVPPLDAVHRGEADRLVRAALELEARVAGSGPRDRP